MTDEMTEEEKLAEEYVNSVIDVDAFDWKIGREIALAYIAGLKAGSQLDKVWQDYDAGEDCYEDSHEGKWVKRGKGMITIEELSAYNRKLVDMNLKLRKENAELKERLERAKEIIKDFVDRDDSCWAIQKKAEEFLRGCQ